MSKLPKHFFIPPLLSDITLHYLCLHIIFHYSVDVPHPTHSSLVTSHPCVIHSLPSISPSYTHYPCITLHLIPKILIGETMQATMTVSRLTRHPTSQRTSIHPHNYVFLPLPHYSRSKCCHTTPFFVLLNRYPLLMPGKRN
jgi:hypothetical protein